MLCSYHVVFEKITHMDKTNAAREFWQNFRWPLADHQRTSSRARGRCTQIFF